MLSRTILLVFLLSSAGGGCTRYFFRDAPELAPAPQDGPRSRIALVGFAPFLTTLKEREVKGAHLVHTYVAELHYEESYAKRFGVGVPIAQIPVTGVDRTVNREAASQFAVRFLTRAKVSGLREMNLMFEGLDQERPGYESSLFLRKRAVDYYLVSVHLPYFQAADSRTASKITRVLMWLSLGLLPHYEVYPTMSTFELYDARLNLVKTWTFKNTFWSLTAVWMPPSDTSPDFPKPAYRSPMPDAFHADLDQARQALIQFLGDRTPRAP